MKTIKVVAAVICDSLENMTKIFATARGYGEFKGQWEFPGGKIEVGETSQQALIREIQEELNAKIEVGKLIDTIEYDYPTFHLSMDCFWCVDDYFFIIDEINRGNLSKIFGELFMLIENDKRGISLQLLYSDEKFAVPKNVYIIGMMNTADRSLAMLDYALRRRFAFFGIKPGFETDGFREYRMAIDNEKFNKLINCVENLNNAISADESLGDGFCIGHSYFCNLSAESIDDHSLSGIVEYELIPLLKEYWFDEPLKVKDWSNNLRSAIK